MVDGKRNAKAKAALRVSGQIMADAEVRKRREQAGLETSEGGIQRRRYGCQRGRYGRRYGHNGRQCGLYGGAHAHAGDGGAGCEYSRWHRDRMRRQRIFVTTSIAM
eukprot:252108-Prorocentrum_minimum.AAC.2